jgi:hypothetical protein
MLPHPLKDICAWLDEPAAFPLGIRHARESLAREKTYQDEAWRLAF